MSLINLVSMETESVLGFWAAVRIVKRSNPVYICDKTTTHIHTFVISHSQADCQYLNRWSVIVWHV